MGWRHLPQREIALGSRGHKVGLRDAAPRGIAPALDREELVYVAIRDGRSRLVNKASFQNGSSSGLAGEQPPGGTELIIMMAFTPVSRTPWVTLRSSAGVSP